MKRRTLPTQALRAYIKLNYQNAERETIAHLIGMETKSYGKMLCRPHISWTHADIYAIKLGTHPVNIWPNWYEITRGYND